VDITAYRDHDFLPSEANRFALLLPQDGRGLLYLD